MMKAPLRPGTRPVGAAQLAVKDTLVAVAFSLVVYFTLQPPAPWWPAHAGCAVRGPQALATSEMEHAKRSTATSTNWTGAREKRLAKFAAKSAAHKQLQLPRLPPPLSEQLPPLPRVQANAPRVLPVQPVERQHRHAAPFVHSSVQRVKSQVLTPLSTSPARSKSGTLCASQMASRCASQLGRCVGIVCCVILLLVLPGLPFGFRVVIQQQGVPTRDWPAATGTRAPPGTRVATATRRETVETARNDPSARGTRLQLLRYNIKHRSPFQNRTRRAYVVGARLAKGAPKAPIIPTSNEHRVLVGTWCPRRLRDRSKSKELPVIIFTHLRRTGGSVLEKGVFWPGVACDQGIVPPPSPSPSPPRSVYRATPGGHLLYQAEAPHKALPTLSERRAIQQARDSLLAAVLFNCHEGSVGRFASASANDRLKFASKMRRAALVWRHCPYGVHELLPGGELATARRVQTARAAPLVPLEPVPPACRSSSTWKTLLAGRVQDLRARADGTDPESLAGEQRTDERRQPPKLLEPCMDLSPPPSPPPPSLPPPPQPPKAFTYVTLLRHPVSQPRSPPPPPRRHFPRISPAPPPSSSPPPSPRAYQLPCSSSCPPPALAPSPSPSPGGASDVMASVVRQMRAERFRWSELAR